MEGEGGEKRETKIAAWRERRGSAPDCDVSTTLRGDSEDVGGGDGGLQWQGGGG